MDMEWVMELIQFIDFRNFLNGLFGPVFCSVLLHVLLFFPKGEDNYLKFCT